MIDIAKQFEYWLKGADEDFAVAKELIALKRIRHGLFFVHLALEKALKAHVCRKTNDFAPLSHNLLMLSQRSGLVFNTTLSELFAELNEFSIEGRYPGLNLPQPSVKEAEHYLARAEEALEWLKKQ